MPKQFNLSTFLELAPNELLKEYLAEHQVGNDLDWNSLSECPCDEIFEAIRAAGPKTQARIELDFQEINRHATPAQIERIISTGRRTYPPIDLSVELPNLGDNLGQCLWLRIKHRKLFDASLMLEQITGHQFELRDDLPAAIVDIDGHAVNAFRLLISKHFQQTEGRGHNCVVERVQRDGQHIFFCHLQDHAQTEHEFIDGNRIDRTTRWPVFDVILVYDPSAATLQTYIPGSRRAAEQIEKVFGQCFLGDDFSAAPKTLPLYDLSRLVSLDHRFELFAEDLVERIVVREMKLEYIAYPGQYITFSVPKDATDGRAYDLLSDLTGDDDTLIDLFKPIKAKFTATFRRSGPGRQHSRTFSVSAPSTCDLTIDALDEDSSGCSSGGE